MSEKILCVSWLFCLKEAGVSVTEATLICTKAAMWIRIAHCPFCLLCPAQVEINTTDIASNHADYGGGVYADGDGTVIITACSLRSNNGSWGGGITAQGGSIITVSTSNFTENSAVQSGGGAYAYDGTVSNALAVCNLLLQLCQDGGYWLVSGS